MISSSWAMGRKLKGPRACGKINWGNRKHRCQKTFTDKASGGIGTAA